MVQSLISGHRALPRNVFLAELHFHWVGQDFPDYYCCASYVIDFVQLNVILEFVWGFCISVSEINLWRCNRVRLFLNVF